MTPDERRRVAKDAVKDVKDPELRHVAEMSILRHLEDCICPELGPWFSDCPVNHPHGGWKRVGKALTSEEK